MKRSWLAGVAGLMLGVVGAVPAGATVWFSDDFETGWTGDYAAGWQNTDYRHGDPPVGQMMQQTANAGFGTYGLRLTAASVPVSSMFWAGVGPDESLIPHSAMAKQYNPYVSAYYYDDGSAQPMGRAAGQIFAVPDWVNPYIAPGEDWTDVQLGARTPVTAAASYYYVAAGENSPGWQAGLTPYPRSVGWHQLKFQLSALDGRIHFYVDGTEIGTSYRNDYTNLGTEVGLFTMFTTPLSGWGEDKPYTEWDNFEVGSEAVPEPTTMLLLGSGLLGLVGWRRRKRA